jgi:catechol 2,3-dioxygenase-like lactoylglutathione lyase family enzyme
MLDTLEIKAFVPAKDYELSKQFYQDLGFTMRSTSPEVSYFAYGDNSFLLQNYYVPELADNLMMHLQVVDVESWWAHVQASGVAQKYGTRLVPPADQPWRMRDFVVIDPSGVLWRIGQNI